METWEPWRNGTYVKWLEMYLYLYDVLCEFGTCLATILLKSTCHNYLDGPFNCYLRPFSASYEGRVEDFVINFKKLHVQNTGGVGTYIKLSLIGYIGWWRKMTWNLQVILCIQSISIIQVDWSHKLHYQGILAHFYDWRAAEAYNDEVAVYLVSTKLH